jgi:tetratricopeptide (TPR) repeat protein
MTQPRATTRRNAKARANIEFTQTAFAVFFVASIYFMRDQVRHRQLFRAALAALSICLCAVAPLSAQTTDEDDPIKLFERGQDAHAKNDYKTAIELYEAAIKLKPEFPEAEFQRAMALLVTNRKPEALEGFHRAVALRPAWAFAYSKFGTLLGSYFNDPQAAEPILRRALELKADDVDALIVLAEIRQGAGDIAEALTLIKRATSLPAAKSSTWRKRSFIEFAAGDKAAALSSLDKALLMDPQDLGARFDRARTRLDAGHLESAFEDIRVLELAGHGSDLPATLELAHLYDRAGKKQDALRVLDGLNETQKRMPEVIALRADISGGSGSTAEERAALEALLEKDQKNASLLARLGNAYRKVDPAKSLDYYYRALQIEPANADYAIGYAAALVQAGRFTEAVNLLRQVLARKPDEYVAHTNLAIALFEMKDFRGALTEYEWISVARPELAAPYFFIAAAHDNLQQYQQALEAYEKFLARADPAANNLEIGKVNLRLPVLRDQIKRGQGAKRQRP